MHCFIERYIADLDLVKPEQRVTRGVHQRGPRWICPPASTMKINVDATISKNMARSTAAAIARNGAGSFQGASMLVIRYHGSKIGGSNRL
jgi:hypothetical protein